MKSKPDIQNETLSAWLDGALDPAEASDVEVVLAERPELQRQLGLMMVNERRLRSGINRMEADRPVPQALAALLESPDSAERRPWHQTLSDWMIRPAFGPGLAAASVVAALLVGVFAGEQLRPDPLDPSPLWAMSDGKIAPGHPSYALLETRASGRAITLGEGVEGQVAFSFQRPSGQWCRQFEQRHLEAEEALAAVACREAGQWRIELAQRIDRPVDDGGHYHAASAAGLDAVDAFVMQHGSGEVIVGDPENELIERGWR